VVAALVREALARPRAEQHLERLLEACALLRRVEVEARVLVLEIARAHSEVEAAAREHVDHRVVLGGAQRVVERQHDHAEPRRIRRVRMALAASHTGGRGTPPYS
jgi:hypothetical protein